MNCKNSISPLITFSKKLKFKYHKVGDYWNMLVESPSIRAMRNKYFTLLNQYRAENKYITYMDETYLTIGQWDNNKVCNQLKNKVLSETQEKVRRLIIIHGGGINGFVENGLLIFDSDTKPGVRRKGMNYEIFSKWMTENYLPNLPDNSVIILDNAPYHNTQLVRAPNQTSRKRDMKKWLDDKGISYRPNVCKSILYDQVLEHKEANIKYKIDETVKSMGHIILRLPPYHTELNPIESIWMLAKSSIMKRNSIDIQKNDIIDIAMEEFLKITCEDWQNSVSCVDKIEKFYIKFDPCFNKTIHNSLLFDDTYEDQNAALC